MHCVQCRHLLDPHVVVAIAGNPRNGGIILCVEGDCTCVATWAPDGVEPPHMPTEEQVEAFRAKAKAAA